jgi:hypothetical protein
MRPIQHKKLIEASIHRVWAILVDVERWPEWNASVTQVEKFNSRPLGLGSQVRIHQPRLRPAIWVVTTFEPERCFVWKAAHPGIALVGSHILEACDQGSKITLGLRFDGWFGGLAGLLKGRLAERYVRSEAEGLRRRSQARFGIPRRWEDCASGADSMLR